MVLPKQITTTDKLLVVREEDRSPRGDQIRPWPKPLETENREPTDGRVGNYCYDTLGTDNLIVIWKHDGDDNPPTCSTDPRCILSVSEWVSLTRENAILICTSLDKNDAITDSH